MKIIFLISIILIELFNIILAEGNIISLPIESFQYQGEKNEEQDQTILDKLLDSKISSIVNIGYNPYPLKAFLDSKNPYFYISNNCYISKSILSSFDYQKNFNYNRHTSKSFYNTSNFDLSFSQSRHACTAKEDFEIFKMNKMETFKENFDFILAEDTKEDETNCLFIGLLESQNPESDFKYYNLIPQLKQKGIIEKLCWTMKFNMPVNYDKDYIIYDADELLNLKGTLYIGNYPHFFDSNNYYESQFVKTYAAFGQNMMKLNLKFNKVYYRHDNKEIKFDEDKIIDLNPSQYLIIGPEEYFDSILENFFNKYLENHICHYHYMEEYTGIYCEKSEKFSINEIKFFPTLFFEHVEFEYIFSLSFQDLFIEKDGKYYFMIITDTLYVKDQWILGNIFMRKYQFIFNLESKEIGFYNPNFEIKENSNKNKDSSKIILYVLLIISLCVIVVGIGFFIKMKFYPSVLKKKRANELDDEYEYVSHKNNTNNNDNNNDNDNQLFNNSINSE